MARVMRSDSRRYVPFEKQLFLRPPQTTRVPSAFMASVSGYFRATQAGITAVGVPRITLMPCPERVSMASSSQVKSKRPSSGSMSTQPNSARRATLKPASFMSSAS